MTVSRRVLLSGGLTVTAVGMLGAARPARAGTTDTAIPFAGPRIYGCDEWGARPPAGTIKVLNRKPAYIVVHHTAGGNSTDLSLEHAFAVARDIQNAHMDGRGWIDSGQQLTNSRGGHVTEGRHRSLEALNDGTRHVQGAHVANHNNETIGIENEGLYSDVDVTPELWDSLVGLVAHIAARYGLAPSAIRGHRDFNSTECPGTVLYGRLPELREAVGALLDAPVLHPETWPLLKPGDTGARVQAAQHLLRAGGAREVQADGVFGPATFAAVARLADQHGVAAEPCYAGRVADERGLLGVTVWPLLVRPVPAGAAGEAGQAVRVLRAASGERTDTGPVVDTADWRRLLG